MKAQPTYLLANLSNNDVTFFIPPYQRNYEWSTDTCKVFLDDVIKVAKSNRSGTNAEHFFGSIVYVIEETGFGVPAKYVLTDGQQRITTTMLFLMALRDTLEDERYQTEIQKRYLENDRAGRDTEYKIKLKQVETDWEAYLSLALRHDVPPALKNSIVFQNYQFFIRELKKIPDSERQSLLEDGLMRFSVISIQLEPDRNPWENPQEIFESMNSLGKPLSLADLVRNYLLMGKSTRTQTSLYNNFWLKLEKLLPGKLSEFIRDWMQADQHRSYKVARESNYKELYGDFKELVRDREVESLFQELVDFSRPYAIACGVQPAGVAGIDRALDDLHIIGVAPAYSYLTEALRKWLSGKLSDAAIETVLISMRTYLLRRRILGITQAENKFFPVLGARLGEFDDSPNLTETMFEQLSSHEYALRLPNNDELTLRFQSMNFYNLGRSRNYPRLLLSLAEEYLTKSRPVWTDDRLQLEHIMPQTLSPTWHMELGENAETTHQELVNNIGNIALIRHNQELGNKPFSEKRSLYSGRSGLQVTQNRVLDTQTWNGEAIIRRRDYLIDLLVNNVLHLPPPFSYGSNWRQGNAKRSQFDSRKVLNQLIGENIVYISQPTITARVVTDSKVEFEGREWNLSPLTRELRERAGTLTPSGSYQGALYWSWDDTPLTDLDL